MTLDESKRSEAKFEAKVELIPKAELFGIGEYIPRYNASGNKNSLLILRSSAAE
jgi:hypothetical protein